MALTLRGIPNIAEPKLSLTNTFISPESLLVALTNFKFYLVSTDNFLLFVNVPSTSSVNAGFRTPNSESLGFDSPLLFILSVKQEQV